MTRQRWILAGAGVVLVLIVAGVMSARARVWQQFANAPGWLKAYQPPDGIANQAEPVPAAWAACCRPSPMVAPCDGYGAGRRVRKTYADNLAAEPSSLIRARINGSAEVGGC